MGGERANVVQQQLVPLQLDDSSLLSVHLVGGEACRGVHVRGGGCLPAAE